MALRHPTGEENREKEKQISLPNILDAADFLDLTLIVIR
uniref:Uncharacterized protein n=1 Tax=Rhizophora mucronata TaxID=61149 RepID=A0A2P2Q0I6_RHIMU